MKTLVIILSAIGLLSLNSCNQGSDPKTLLENPETRTEIFNDITENHDYMTEFMVSMHKNEHAMQMMQGNKEMMSNMMMGEGKQMMMKDMMGNKEMMHSMMSEMMGNGKMMGDMMQMMHKDGMMSEDCMKSCMKMMGDKRMDMTNMMDNNKNNHKH